MDNSQLSLLLLKEMPVSTCFKVGNSLFLPWKQLVSAIATTCFCHRHNWKQPCLSKKVAAPKSHHFMIIRCLTNFISLLLHNLTAIDDIHALLIHVLDTTALEVED